MSGRDVGEVPFRISSWVGRHLLAPFVLRVLFHRILTREHTPRPEGPAGVLSRGGPLIRTKQSNLTAAGVERAGRVAGRGGRPVLADGRVMSDVANVIWCTGYHAGFDWIDLPGARRARRAAARERRWSPASPASTSWACISCTRFRPR